MKKDSRVSKKMCFFLSFCVILPSLYAFVAKNIGIYQNSSELIRIHQNSIYLLYSGMEYNFRKSTVR